LAAIPRVTIERAIHERLSTLWGVIDGDDSAARLHGGPFQAGRYCVRTNWLKESLTLAVILVGVLAGTPAGAEWFADVAIGTALTHAGDVNTTEDVEYDKSFTMSGRVGRWLEGRFGWAVNLFRFEPDISSQTDPTLTGFTDIDVTALSLDVMMKVPYRFGRFRPYATGGPAIFFSTINSRGNFGNASATDTSLGWKFGLGFVYPFRNRLDLFGEYRYTSFSIDTETTAGSSSQLEMDVTTSHFVVGVIYRF
jgi:opacity protein-like surface antigen